MNLKIIVKNIIMKNFILNLLIAISCSMLILIGCICVGIYLTTPLTGIMYWLFFFGSLLVVIPSLLGYSYVIFPKIFSKHYKKDEEIEEDKI